MNKETLLSELSLKLSGIPKEEKEKTLFYYEEMINDKIEDGISEEEAVKAFGSFEEIEKNIKLEMPLSKLMKERIDESRKKSSNKTLWITLAILGCPLWVPLIFAFAMVIFAFYIVIWSLVFSLFVVIAAFGISSVFCFIGGIVTLFIKPAPGLCSIGAAFVLASLTLFLIKPMIFVVKEIIKFSSYILRKIKSLFIKKGGSADEIK